MPRRLTEGPGAGVGGIAGAQGEERRTIGRRSVVTVGGFGISSLVLPPATAAASTLLFEPSALSYGQNDRVVAAWSPFDSDDATAYTANEGNGILGKRISLDGLTAFLNVGGTQGEAGDPSVIGADSVPSTYAEWTMRNSAAGVTFGTTPHLRFFLGVTSGTLTLATFVLHAVRNLAGGSDNPVNLAAYVTATGVNGGALVLRRTAQISTSYGGASTFRRIVVNLGLADRSFTAGQSVEVRIHPYATTEARNVRFARYDSDPLPVAHTSADTLNGVVVNGDLENSGQDGEGNWMAAFVGAYQEPPETP